MSAAYRNSGGSRGQRLARLAARQHGVVGVRQLDALGYSRSAVVREVRAGRLHRLHQGAYAVGHPRIDVRGRWMAAVIACGSKAVLSHASAGALWELRAAHGSAIDVTRIGRSRRCHGHVRLHGVRNLHPDDVTRRDAIPVTTVPRTLLDLAEVLHPQRLRRALEEAERRDLLDARVLEETLTRASGRHGLKAMRAALAAHTGFAPWTQSELEDAFLTLIRGASLPEPRTNVLLHGELVDCFWPAVPLVVELDGYEFHRTRRSFEDDRRRDAKLQLHGLPVLRLTQPRLEQEPEQVLREVEHMLSRR